MIFAELLCHQRELLQQQWAATRLHRLEKERELCDPSEESGESEPQTSTCMVAQSDSRLKKNIIVIVKGKRKAFKGMQFPHNAVKNVTVACR